MSRPGDRIDRRFRAWLRISKNKKVWPVVLMVSGPDRWKKEIAKGCAALGLDESNPAHKDVLLGILSEVHFGETSKNALAIAPGDAPKKLRKPKTRWQGAEITEFAKDVYRNRVVIRGKFDVQRTAEKLKKIEKYKSLSLPTLRAYIRYSPGELQSDGSVKPAHEE